MLNKYARAFFTGLFTPIARALVRLGVSPDVVTLVGTIGVCFGALAFYPRGEFFWGTVVITLFVFSDMVDGIMARTAQRSSAWGAFLDSTLDRVGDAAVFSGLLLYYAGQDGDRAEAMKLLSLACLVLGSVVPYARARAEGLGMTASVGIAERADRLVSVLVITGLVGMNWTFGFGLPEVVLLVVLALLTVASFVTVVQRMLTVRTQAFGRLLPVAGPSSAVGTDEATSAESAGDGV